MLSLHLPAFQRYGTDTNGDWRHKRWSIEPASIAIRPCRLAASQTIADNDPAEQSSTSHSATDNSSRTRYQNSHLATVFSRQVIFVATDHVTSPPPVASTNSGSTSRAANSSACPLTMASRLPSSSDHHNP